ncbi:hypothetical protein OG754_38835 [Streptomyces decoyicus]|uniref:hypothetical protein n=1 Tax=Streptomyces decoyicus TaxID=249567 RepID=UPI002E344A44|nr:hypothetical protein [Streptomyces decoyicus]
MNTTETELPVPAWANRVAHAIPLVALPVCLWRLPVISHGMGGEPLSPTVGHIAYVVALSVLSEIAALLSFGLVRGWGERVPAWVPRLRGKRIPPAAALVPATAGGLVLTAILGFWLYNALIFGPEAWPYAPGWNILAMTVSGLMNLWGPLVLILGYAYYRRRVTAVRNGR